MIPKLGQTRATPGLSKLPPSGQALKQPENPQDSFESGGSRFGKNFILAATPVICATATALIGAELGAHLQSGILAGVAACVGGTLAGLAIGGFGHYKATDVAAGNSRSAGMGAMVYFGMGTLATTAVGLGSAVAGLAGAGPLLAAGVVGGVTGLAMLALSRS